MQSLELEQKARTAIVAAVRRFPSVLGQLLSEDVHFENKSFDADWRSIMGNITNLQGERCCSELDSITRSRTLQAYDLVAGIFAKQNSKLWCSEDTLLWLSRCLVGLTSCDSLDPVLPLSPALSRYIGIDPADYADKFETMPADANPLDPGLVALAVEIDPNRPRRMQLDRRGFVGRDEFGLNAVPQQRIEGLAGPPTQNIDPDLPLLEVYWRSALPWNRVDGVPPPRR